MRLQASVHATVLVRRWLTMAAAWSLKVSRWSNVTPSNFSVVSTDSTAPATSTESICSDAKDLGKNQAGSPPSEAPNAGGWGRLKFTEGGVIFNMEFIIFYFWSIVFTIHGSAVYAVVVCLSVRLSVCLSSRCSTETAKRRITQTTPHDCTRTLFWRRRSRQKSSGVTSIGGAKCRWVG